MTVIDIVFSFEQRKTASHEQTVLLLQHSIIDTIIQSLLLNINIATVCTSGLSHPFSGIPLIFFITHP